jgi:hypothetical protein
MITKPRNVPRSYRRRKNKRPENTSLSREACSPLAEVASILACAYTRAAFDTAHSSDPA